MYKKEGVRPFFGANSYIIPKFLEPKTCRFGIFFVISRTPWLRTGCIFYSTSDAALALPIPPKVRSHHAAHTLASAHTFFLKNAASPYEYATHSSLS